MITLSHRVLGLYATCLLALAACKKEPGIGGDASIKGRIWVKDYNTTFTNLIGEYPGKDVYVYIVYGENEGYDKRIKTDYNGVFVFKNLYKGNYTIYAYSADSTLTDLSGEVPVIRKITINERKEEVETGDIIVFN
jgi:hypothetical protein